MWGGFMTPEELWEYLEMLRPAVEECARKNNMSVEQLVLEWTILSNTGLFNYKEKQNVVYNRFVSNKVDTLGELFRLYDSGGFNYGVNNSKSDKNYYIHDEIDGIVALLKFRFLQIEPVKIRELLNYKIDMNFDININNQNLIDSSSFDICNLVYVDYGVSKDVVKKIDEFYKVLKSCGFNHISVKILINMAYLKRIQGITLEEFLSNLSLEEISLKFKDNEKELSPFLNILRIIQDICIVYNKNDVQNHKKH